MKYYRIDKSATKVLNKQTFIEGMYIEKRQNKSGHFYYMLIDESIVRRISRDCAEHWISIGLYKSKCD